jgi:hypothetical protein
MKTAASAMAVLVILHDPDKVPIACSPIYMLRLSAKLALN